MLTANQGCEETEEQCDCGCHRSESGASELNPVADRQRKLRKTKEQADGKIVLEEATSAMGTKLSGSPFLLSAFGWSDEKLVAVVTMTKLDVHLLVGSKEGSSSFPWSGVYDKFFGQIFLR